MHLLTIYSKARFNRIDREFYHRVLIWSQKQALETSYFEKDTMKNHRDKLLFYSYMYVTQFVKWNLDNIAIAICIYTTIYNVKIQYRRNCRKI